MYISGKIFSPFKIFIAGNCSLNSHKLNLAWNRLATTASNDNALIFRVRFVLQEASNINSIPKKQINIVKAIMQRSSIILKLNMKVASIVINKDNILLIINKKVRPIREEINITKGTAIT